MHTADRVPWNQDRSIGPRLAFEQQEILLLESDFQTFKSPHDLCLLRVGVDSMLRAVDLLGLRVVDVTYANGDIRSKFWCQQQKTDYPVASYLTEKTREVLKQWIEFSGKKPQDFIFTRYKSSPSNPICVDWYRKLVKQWAQRLDLHSEDYSSHSIRRSKPMFLFLRGTRIEYISTLLGHQSVATTLRYLGITDAKAEAEAVKHDIFNSKLKPQVSRTSSYLSRLKRPDLRLLGKYIAEELRNDEVALPDIFD